MQSSVPTGACRYSAHYTCQELLWSPAATASFLQDLASAESHFHVPGVSYDAGSGFTYDGHALDYATGELSGIDGLHTFSAPSKESLHLSLLALGIVNNSIASTFCSSLGNGTGGIDAILGLLEKKMDSYEQFNASFPGYGCFLPWVNVNASGLYPVDNWMNPYRVPSLDNGEWVWSILAVSQALSTLARASSSSLPARALRIVSLQGRYAAWFNCMSDNAKAIFYRGEGIVSTCSVILQVQNATIAPSNYAACDQGRLNDPYEGETLTVLLDLFADWSSDPQDRDLMWEVKRPQLQPVNYTLTGGSDSGGTLTTQLGYWFSAHEQWKTLLLPYFDTPLVQRIFENGEIARTIDAAEQSIPGLFASVNDVTNGSLTIPDYVSATGIASLASQTVKRRDVVTPYGSFNIFMHNASVGACHYLTMIQGARMQGPYGSTEASNINGTEIAPLTTWDSKITTVLAAAGGSLPLVREALRALQQGRPYDRFVQVITREYSLAFAGQTHVEDHNLTYAIPTCAIPHVLSPWSSCPP